MSNNQTDSEEEEEEEEENESTSSGGRSSSCISLFFSGLVCGKLFLVFMSSCFVRPTLKA